MPYANVNVLYNNGIKHSYIILKFFTVTCHEYKEPQITADWKPGTE